MNILNYLAGIIDGEGCISIAKVKPNGFNKTPRFFFKLTIEMQDKKVIDYLAVNFNRNIMEKKAYGNKKRPSYRIDWQADKASEILTKVKPYLIGKKEQAELGIKYQKHISSKNRSGRMLSDEEIAIRDNFYTIMRQLKLNP